MTIIFDGIASGMLLFLISVGLSVTLGLMNFVNLAHGAFAMVGGYACVILFGQVGVPFLASLVLSALISTALGVGLERLLYRRLYGASQLDQVLLSVGLLFVAMALTQWVFGPQPQPMRLPGWLLGQYHLGTVDIGVYRVFIVALGLAVALGLHLTIGITRFGARLRAAVDKPAIARGLGIDVDRVFVTAFAIGSGLAGLGGAVGVDVLGLDPGFPIRFLVYCLIVVAVGGSGSIQGSLIASILIGIADVTGKYYLPQAGAFIIYTVMVVTLIVRPQGIFGRKGA